MKTNKLFALAIAMLSLVACNPDTNEVTVEKVVIDPAMATIKVNDTKQLTATVTPEGAGTVAWESSNLAVATVDDKGLVTAVAKGEAYITATAGGKTGMCSVTVFEEGQTVVTLDKPSLSLVKGSSETLKATVEPADKASELVWSSDNEAVATVKDGVVTAVAKGSANIKAAVGDVEAVCAVKVTDPTGEDETVNHVSLQGSNYYVIQLGEKEGTQIKDKIIASFMENKEDKFLYIWSDGNCYAAGDTQGKNFYGLTEGWVSLTVGSVGWSGLGYSCNNMEDLNKMAAIMDEPENYYLHIGMRSADTKSHIIFMDGTTGSAKICIGKDAMEADGKQIAPYTDFVRDGEWHEIEIPMSDLINQGLVYGKNNTEGKNVFGFLSGGVQGTQLQYDACFIYKKVAK